MTIVIKYLLFLVLRVKSHLSHYQSLDNSFFQDSWGYKINWTNPEDGWNLEKRKMFIDTKRSVSHHQNDVPRYTKIGYKKMSIPKPLYSHIVEMKSRSILKPEYCDIPNSYNNCYRVKNVSVIPFRNRTREIAGW